MKCPVRSGATTFFKGALTDMLANSDERGARMTGKNIGAWVGFAVVSVLVAGSFAFPKQTADQKTVVNNCRTFLARLGLNSTVTDVEATLRTSGPGKIWTVVVRRTNGDLSLMCMENGDVRLFSDYDVQTKVAKQQGATRERAFSDEAAARNRIQQIADSLRQARPIRLRSFSFTQNGLGTPPRRTVVSARYQGLLEGYPVVAGPMYGCRLKVCAQTGRIMEVLQNWRLPAYDKPIRRLDSTRARAALARATNTAVGRWSGVVPKLGWVASKSTSRLRLGWLFSMPGNVESGRVAGSYAIDAENGNLIHREN